MSVWAQLLSCLATWACCHMPESQQCFSLGLAETEQCGLSPACAAKGLQAARQVQAASSSMLLGQRCWGPCREESLPLAGTRMRARHADLL